MAPQGSFCSMPRCSRTWITIMILESSQATNEQRTNNNHLATNRKTATEKRLVQSCLSYVECRAKQEIGTLLSSIKEGHSRGQSPQPTMSIKSPLLPLLRSWSLFDCTQVKEIEPRKNTFERQLRKRRVMCIFSSSSLRIMWSKGTVCSYLEWRWWNLA